MARRFKLCILRMFFIQDMTSISEKIKETIAFLQQKNIHVADIAVVMGTGLGAMTDFIDVIEKIEYKDIPNFPEATVEFHRGVLIYGTIGSKRIIAMQGRFHYYEGYSAQEITFPVRLFKALGCQYLFLSNAAGGLNLSYRKGDMVLIEDHINLQPDNPLRGLTGDDRQNIFVDMSQPYSPLLNEAILLEARKSDVSMRQGVYVSVAGPNLETRAEYRMLRQMGADVVGMSTVPEVIVANHVGLPCAAVSVVTDECDPDSLWPVEIAEILEVASKSDKILSQLLSHVITNLAL